MAIHPKEINLRASDFREKIYINVRGLNSYRWRLKMASFIFRFGAFVAGVGIRFKGTTDE